MFQLKITTLAVAAVDQVVEVDGVALHLAERVVEDHVDVARSTGRPAVELDDVDPVAVRRQQGGDAGDHELVVVDDRDP